MKKTGIELISAERAEQLIKHELSLKHDWVNNKYSELSTVAALLLNPTVVIQDFPALWRGTVLKNILKKEMFERIVIAGALLAAELDRQIYDKCVDDDARIDFSNHLFATSSMADEVVKIKRQTIGISPRAFFDEEIAEKIADRKKQLIDTMCTYMQEGNKIPDFITKEWNDRVTGH